MKVKDVVLLGSVVLAIAFGVFAFKNPSVVSVPELLGGTAGPDYYNTQYFMGGVVRGNYLSTTTTHTATTLRVEDVKDRDVISVLAGGQSTLTYTFFASSSAKNWLPKAGMRQETCFLNATTTAAKTLIFAAGTGIDLQVATSSSISGAKDLTIEPGGTGCFTFIRKAATASAFDIEANLVEYGGADL